MKILLAAAALGLSGGAFANQPSQHSETRTASPPAEVPDQAKASLTIRFEDLVAPTGQIMMSLYDTEAAHDAGGKPVRVGMVKADGTGATVSFADLPPGRYAIKALHDVDGDGIMKANPFGMPLEPFAFSNNAKAEGGPARWQAASFDVPAGATEVRISFK